MNKKDILELMTLIFGTGFLFVVLTGACILMTYLGMLILSFFRF